MTESNHPALTVRRAALYIRVSTDEQARKGYSLPAQRETLETYAKANQYAVAGLYVDDGVSAHQAYTKRPGLMRLLADVEADRIDTILIIKLDRWFRSVKEYYKVQDILDRHHVAWKTVLEDYETETSGGIMMANIMLSVAQAESDRTSDRIKFVFENKVAKGEAITGKTPVGYKIENKHLVPDENADAARAVFRYYAESRSVTATMRYARETLHLPIHRGGMYFLLKNTLYKGEYRGNPNYCVPLISAEEFDAVQDMLEKRSVKICPAGRTYIFGSLCVCKECGQAMSARYGGAKERGYSREYIYYRCNRAVLYHECQHKKSVVEWKLEEWLLENVAGKFEEHKADWALKHRKKGKTQVDRAAILRKLEKLKDLYVNDLITMEEYRADYDRYKAQLAKADAEAAEKTAPDFSRIEVLLSGDFAASYKLLDREKRQIFWRSIIDKIEFDRDNSPDIYFRQYCTNVQ